MSQTLLNLAALCAALFCTPSAFSQDAPRPIELGVKPDGGIIWNGVAVNDAVFEDRLALIAREQPEPQIHILPKRGATYQGVSHLIKMIQPYGFKLGLVGAVSAPSAH